MTKTQKDPARELLAKYSYVEIARMLENAREISERIAGTAYSLTAWINILKRALEIVGESEQTRPKGMGNATKP